MEQTQALEIVIIDDEPRIDSRLVAQRLDIEHESFIKTLQTYESELEELGILRFQIGEITANKRGRGQPQKFVMLNENQATFAATLSRNTPQIVSFKLALVKAFARAKQPFFLKPDFQKQFLEAGADKPNPYHGLPESAKMDALMQCRATLKQIDDALEENDEDARGLSAMIFAFGLLHDAHAPQRNNEILLTTILQIGRESRKQRTQLTTQTKPKQLTPSRRRRNNTQ